MSVGPGRASKLLPSLEFRSADLSCNAKCIALQTMTSFTRRMSFEVTCHITRVSPGSFKLLLRRSPGQSETPAAAPAAAGSDPAPLPSTATAPLPSTATATAATTDTNLRAKVKYPVCPRANMAGWLHTARDTGAGGASCGTAAPLACFFFPSVSAISASACSVATCCCCWVQSPSRPPAPTASASSSSIPTPSALHAHTPTLVAKDACLHPSIWTNGALTTHRWKPTQSTSGALACVCSAAHTASPSPLETPWPPLATATTTIHACH
jgi:hypothetical protein